MTEPTANKHPAPFSEPIIEALADLIPEHVPPGWIVHDPFAGEGKRLGALCDRLGYKFSGSDLEPWLDADPRVDVGDSTRFNSYPFWTGRPFSVVTSPTYNNGLNDHFKPGDTSRRLTYRVAAGRELHPHNTGRYSGRGSKAAEAAYWELTKQCVKHWPSVALVNVKDSVRAGEVYPLVVHWADLLEGVGYTVDQHMVECPGWRFGANSAARADSESILIARRRGR